MKTLEPGGREWASAQRKEGEKEKGGNRNVPPIHHDSTKAAININPRAKKTKKAPKKEIETDSRID